MPRVSTYPDASLPPGGGDLLYLVQGGNSRRLSITGLRTIVAPIPQGGAGVGEWTLVFGAAGAPVVLPAGGTWAWYMLRRTVATGAINSVSASIGAGGSTIAAGLAGVDSFALVWRIS